MNDLTDQAKLSFIKNDEHPNTVVHKCACNYLVPYKKTLNKYSLN